MMSCMTCLAFVVALASCGGQTPAEPEASREPAQNGANAEEASGSAVKLRLDESTDHAGLKIVWTELEDSRCPIGTSCVWAGQLIATLEIRHEGDEPAIINLTHRIGDDPLTETAFGFEFRLLDVEPHPKEGVTNARSDYVAEIEISPS